MDREGQGHRLNRRSKTGVGRQRGAPIFSAPPLLFGELFCRGSLCGGEVAGAPQVPACDRAPGGPLAGAFFHVGGFGEQCGCELGFRLETLEGEGEAFADAVVAGGEDVGAAEAEHEEHFDRPAADAADLGEVLDDVVVGHAADAGEGGDGAVEGLGGEVAEGEGFVVGEAGGAKLLVGAVEEVLRVEVDGVAVGLDAGDEDEAFKQAAVDGGGGLAVELLVEDGLREGLEGRLLRGQAEGEGAGLRDEAGEFGVGGGERGDGDGGVIGQLASGAGTGAGHGGSVPRFRHSRRFEVWAVAYHLNMVVQVQKLGNRFTFVLPPEVARELDLEDGSAVEIRRADNVPAPAFRYASVDEVMEAHREMEPQYAETYRELAK
jgi:antitoxin component of MazEF toxin-antitoxin module